MFVALLDDQLIGTSATLFINKNFWCGNGIYAYNCFISVLPEYAGKGVYKAMALKQEEYIKSKNVNRVFFDTHEKNKRIIEVSKKNGYEFVDFIIRKKHNSVYMVKWLDNPPYTHLQCTKNFWKIKICKKYRTYKKEYKEKLHV
jgi:RimJ/RimL family protein N-acetyltransferase